MKICVGYDALIVKMYNNYMHFYIEYKDIDKVIEELLKVKEKLKRHIEYCK